MPKPNRKVGASAIAGAVTTLIVGILGMNEIKISPEMTASLTAIIMFVVAYFVPEPKSS